LKKEQASRLPKKRVIHSTIEGEKRSLRDHVGSPHR
jgi:hypothetical protein